MTYSVDLRGQGTEDEVARTATKKKAAAPAGVVQQYVVRLHSAVGDKAAFDAAVAALLSDNGLSGSDVILIADKFAIPSERIGSRAAAVAAMNKRFVELVRFRAKNAIAAKTRPW
jgi:hypothetical protein